LVSPPRAGFDAATVVAALTERGLTVPVRVEVVDAIEPGPGGKASLVVEAG
jgi:hypothetical protein